MPHVKNLTLQLILRTCAVLEIQKMSRQVRKENAPRASSQQKQQQHARQIHFRSDSIPSGRARTLSSYFDGSSQRVYSVTENHHSRRPVRPLFSGFPSRITREINTYTHTSYRRSQRARKSIPQVHNPTNCTSFVSQNRTSRRAMLSNKSQSCVGGNGGAELWKNGGSSVHRPFQPASRFITGSIPARAADYPSATRATSSTPPSPKISPVSGTPCRAFYRGAN